MCTVCTKAMLNHSVLMSVDITKPAETCPPAEAQLRSGRRRIRCFPTCQLTYFFPVFCL